MNITTAALWVLASWARENALPSTVGNVKSGAAAPICGPAARTACARARTPAAIIRSRAGRIANSSFSAPQDSGPAEYSRQEAGEREDSHLFHVIPRERSDRGT